MESVNPPHTGRPVTLARNGMVSTPHYLATTAGVQALLNGGTAVDALIAANAVLCVVYPHMAGLGGDCFWLLWNAREGKLSALDGNGRRCQAATIDLYRRRGLSRIPLRGPLAANTVPGAVDSWVAAHERYGRLQWASLFNRAVDYAHNGVPVATSTARWLARDREVLTQHSPAGRIFLKDGRPYRAGEVLVQSDLATSLREIASTGRHAFYTGHIAGEIVRHLRAHGGLLSLEDFAEQRSDWQRPIGTTYRGYEAYSLRHSAQGLATLFILNLIEGYDVKGLGDGSADYLHIVIEATKLAFADRDRRLADPLFAEVPAEALLAKEYAAQSRDEIDPRRACPWGAEVCRPSQTRLRPWGAEVCRPSQTRLRPWGEVQAALEATQSVRGHTVWLGAVDKDGNCASCLQSIGQDFGSAVVGGDTGILLQNRGSFLSLDSGRADRLEPHKRTFDALAPLLMVRQGRPRLLFGATGGEAQPQVALATRALDFGYDAQQCVEAPRWLWRPAGAQPSRSLALEARFPEETAVELRRRGHAVELLAEWSDAVGHAGQIHIDPDDGVLMGAADPRSDGAAMGW